MTISTDPKERALVIGGILAGQARPTSDAYGAAEAAYRATTTGGNVSVSGTNTLTWTPAPEEGERLFHVDAEEVAASIMRYLERVTDDDGGNAARYFPAVMVARMARAIAKDINTAASADSSGR